MATVEAFVGVLAKKAGTSIPKLATKLGVARQTMYNRLREPDSARDPLFWDRVARELKVTVEELMVPPADLAPSSRNMQIGHDFLDLLLDVLENPNEKPTRKAAVRAHLHQWVEAKPFSNVA